MNTNRILQAVRFLPAVLLFLVAAPALACNVPVFRYALERWPADPYEVFVFHRGPLDPEAKAAVALLQKHAGGAGSPANLNLHLLDLDKNEADEALLKWLQTQGNPELPWMVVRYPLATGINVTVWSGRLSPAAATALLDSPVRREITKRIASGETAVWLLLECGDQKKDDAAARLLQTHLAKLQTTLQLPELTDPVADRIAPTGPPLRIRFSLIRLPRSSPDEHMLIHMLLHSEEDLTDFTDEPMAFPVFGRGRALWALVGKGITEENIDEAGAFLVGPCSCEVKRQNPGTDLLMTADWDSLIEGGRVVKDRPLPPLHGLSDFLAAAGDQGPELLPVGPRPLESDPAEGRSPPQLVQGPAERSAGSAATEPAAPNSGLVLLRNIGLGVLVGLAVLAAWGLILKGKNER
ncbi:MAG TPA: hypothetical protein VNK04_17995 [Gemmataceae bacterium]|nr:hypothetical protein [Gemmataceae bacterium]